MGMGDGLVLFGVDGVVHVVEELLLLFGEFKGEELLSNSLNLEVISMGECW